MRARRVPIAADVPDAGALGLLAESDLRLAEPPAFGSLYLVPKGDREFRVHHPQVRNARGDLRASVLARGVDIELERPVEFRDFPLLDAFELVARCRSAKAAFCAAASGYLMRAALWAASSPTFAARSCDT
jgi:hypothetical protein